MRASHRTRLFEMCFFELVKAYTCNCLCARISIRVRSLQHSQSMANTTLRSGRSLQRTTGLCSHGNALKQCREPNALALSLSLSAVCAPKLVRAIWTLAGQRASKRAMGMPNFSHSHTNTLKCMGLNWSAQCMRTWPSACGTKLRTPLERTRQGPCCWHFRSSRPSTADGCKRSVHYNIDLMSSKLYPNILLCNVHTRTV